MTKESAISEIEREVSQLRADQNLSAHQRLQFLTKQTELLLKLHALKSKYQEGRGSKSKKILKVVSSPLLLTITAGLLTSLIAPYIIERSKEKAAVIQQENEKRDTIRKTQFEIIEKLNTLMWGYRASAEFLIWDFVHDEPDKAMVKKHIEDYDKLTSATNRDYNAEAFRARMYFNDPQVYELLMGMYDKLDNLDNRINNQMISQNKDPGIRNADTDEQWKQIQKQLYQNIDETKVVLNKLFDQIR